MIQGFLPTYSGCLVCGNRRNNPVSMQVRFYWDGEKIDTPVNPDIIYNGYEGILHGGIISALLDEGMGWAAALERRAYFVTGELNIRFLRPIKTGASLRLVCKATEHLKRYSISQGEIIDESGKVLAKGSGKFFEMSAEEADKTKQYLTFQEGDIDILNL